MTAENKRLRDALLEVETLAVAALANQPECDERCGLHLKLAVCRARDVLIDAIQGAPKAEGEK